MYLNLQVEPNAQKIEEHRRKYERLRRERELKKIERDRQQKRAAAQVIIKTYHEVSSIIKMFSLFFIFFISYCRRLIKERRRWNIPLRVKLQWVAFSAVLLYTVWYMFSEETFWMRSNANQASSFSLLSCTFKVGLCHLSSTCYILLCLTLVPCHS